MSEWTRIHLGDGLRVHHGFAFKGEFFSPEGHQIVLTPGNFVERGGFKPKSGAEKYYLGPVPEKFILKEGDVVIAMTEQAQGLLGSSATIPEDDVYLHNQRIGLLEITDAELLDQRYVYHLMNSPEVRRQIQATATGSKVRHTAPERVHAVVAPVPLLTEQRLVASVLDAIEDLIENNRRRVEVLEEMARAIYREWFVKFRYPGHEEVLLVESASGLIPEGWESRTLGDVSRNLDRLRQPLSKMQREQRRGTIPYYGAAKLIDLVDDWIFDGEYLLFAEDGSVETTAGFPVLQMIRGKFWANNHTHILEGLDVSTRFLRLACQRVPIRPYVTGAAQPKITQANLNRIPIVVGGLSIHEAFDATIDPLFDAAYALTQMTTRLIALRDLLLPKLVAGQIDISTLDLDGLRVGSVA